RARQRPALAIVVVAELHDHHIARLEPLEDFIPVTDSPERARARAADGAIDDIDLRRIEERRERVAPAELTVITIAPAVAHGGITDEEDCWQRWIGQLGQIQPTSEANGIAFR